MKLVFKIKNKYRNYSFQAVIVELGVILRSRNYHTKQGRNIGLISARINSRDPFKYIRVDDVFTLRAGNHREIGRSPKLKPKQLELAMETLMKHGADAPIVYPDGSVVYPDKSK